MATSRFRYTKPTPDEFMDLAKRGGVQLNDFLLLSGRHAVAVLAFIRGTPDGPYVPTMADVMILELAAENPALVDHMIEIANKYAYVEDKPPKVKAVEYEPPEGRYW